MNSHNRTDISCQIPTAGGDSKILDRIQTIGVDHEISVVFINSGGLASIPAIKELCEGLLLNWMNGVHVEPRGITREDDGMCL